MKFYKSLKSILIKPLISKFIRGNNTPIFKKSNTKKSKTTSEKIIDIQKDIENKYQQSNKFSNDVTDFINNLSSYKSVDIKTTQKHKKTQVIESFEDTFNEYKKDSLTEIYLKRKTKRTLEVLNSFNKLKTITLSKKNYEKGVIIYENLLKTIGQKEFESFRKEFEGLKVLCNNYEKELSKYLNDIEKLIQRKDPLVILDAFTELKKSFPTITKKSRKVYDRIEIQYNFITIENRVYKNLNHEFENDLERQNFNEALQLLSKIKKHTFNTPVFHYESAWKLKNEKYKLKFEVYIQNRIISIRDNSKTQVAEKIIEVEKLISRYGTLNKLISFLKELNDIYQQELIIQQKINNDTQELYLKVAALFDKEFYSEVVLEIDNASYIKLSNIKNLVKNIFDLYDRSTNLIAESERKQKQYQKLYTVIENNLEKDLLTDKQIANIEKLLFSFKNHELCDSKIASKFKRRLNKHVKKRIEIKFKDLIKSADYLRIHSDYEKAIQTYQKALQTNVDNELVSSIIKETKELLKKQKHQRKIDELLIEIQNINANTKFSFNRSKELLKKLEFYNYNSLEINRLRKEHLIERGNYLDNNIKRELVRKEIDNALKLNQECYDIGYFDYGEFIDRKNEILKYKKKNTPEISLLGIYYPTNRFKYDDLSMIERNFRKSIWDFKDGKNQNNIRVQIQQLIKNNFDLDSNIVLCIAPASTKSKNNIRFKDFCNKLSSSLNITNGFEFIYPHTDRKQSKGQSGKNVLETIDFNRNKIRNKNIILFDDVITRGETYYQIKSRLLRLNAKSVHGVFIGVTYESKIYNQIN